MKNIFSKDKPDKDYEFTHIVNPKPPPEEPVVKIKESIHVRVSDIIIYSSLIFLFASNVIFFLLISGYKAEIRSFPRKMSSMEQVLSGYVDDAGKFNKDIKKVLLDFQLLNKKIQDTDEAVQILDRNIIAHTSDISRINKEINGLLTRFELLQNDLEQHKEGVKK